MNERNFINDAILFANIRNSVLSGAAQSGSVDTAILRFNVAGTATGVPGTFAEIIAAGDGSEIKISRPGIYLASLFGSAPASGSVAVGISYNASDAAPIVADPVTGVANVLAAIDPITAPAATAIPFFVSAVIEVSAADAVGTIANNLGVVRFHATNSAAGAPVLTAASVGYNIVQIGRSQD